VKQGLDPQERQLSEGMSPLDQKFGVESPSDAGALVSYECGHKRVEAAPSLPGAYLEFYRQLHRAIVQGESPPVRAEEALNVIRLIELADQSSKEGRAVSL
jgi:scyllo-inositol 2-dehydrogenase (NADP+)